MTDISRIEGVPALPAPLFYRLTPPRRVLRGHELHICTPGRFGPKSIAWARVLDTTGACTDPEELIRRAACQAYRTLTRRGRLAAADTAVAAYLEKGDE